MVQRTLIRPPMSRVGPLTPDERRALIEADTANRAKYKDVINRETAHERITELNTPVGQVKDKIRRFGNLLGLSR
jgi:recombinational DNA repair protein RecT